MKSLDDLGDPPLKAQHLADLTRKLFKLRLTTARTCAEALMAHDMAQADRIVVDATPGIVSLQREIGLEVRRVAPEEDVRAADAKIARERLESPGKNR